LQPDGIGIECTPGIDGAVREQGQDNEGGDQQAQACKHVVPTEFGHCTMQWLLVGQDRRGGDRHAHRERPMAHGSHRPQQEGGDGCNLGSEPQLVRFHTSPEDVAGQHEHRDGHHGANEQPRHARGLRYPARAGPDLRNQNESTQTACGSIAVFGLALLTLDADQRANEQRRGKVRHRVEVHCGIHGQPARDWKAKALGGRDTPCSVTSGAGC
jgi:hypothetical protein